MEAESQPSDAVQADEPEFKTQVLIEHFEKSLERINDLRTLLRKGRFDGDMETATRIYNAHLFLDMMKETNKSELKKLKADHRAEKYGQKDE